MSTTPLKKVPAAPKTLSKQATPHWQEIGAHAVSIGTLTTVDLPLLKLCAENLAFTDELRKAIREAGLVLGNSRNGSKANALIKQHAQLVAQNMRLLAALGMTPAARKSLPTTDPSLLEEFE
jgi:P27 family predicted phage terminase small subunit